MSNWNVKFIGLDGRKNPRRDICVEVFWNQTRRLKIQRWGARCTLKYDGKLKKRVIREYWYKEQKQNDYLVNTGTFQKPHHHFITVTEIKHWIKCQSWFCPNDDLGLACWFNAFLHRLATCTTNMTDSLTEYFVASSSINFTHLKKICWCSKGKLEKTARR